MIATGTEKEFEVEMSKDMIKCPVSGCKETWEATLPEAVLIRLMDGYSIHVHPLAPAAAPSPLPAAKAENMRRPTLTSGINSEDYNYFLQSWTDYKTTTSLSGTDIIFQLLESCDEDLRKDLARTYGSLSSKSVTSVLEFTQCLAVKKLNIMVAKHDFHLMLRERDESIRNYTARLRGQAKICNFQVKCNKCKDNVDYSSIEIRDVLVSGLADPDIRENIFSEKD